MELAPTLMIAAVAAGLGVLFGWLGAQPPNLQRGPRLAPYRFLMLVCAAVVMIMLVHLANLAGVTTGRNSGAP